MKPDIRNSLRRRTHIRPAFSSRGVLTRPRHPFRPPLSRHASTAVAESTSLVYRLRNFFYGSTLVLGFSLIYLYLTDTRASAHKWLVIPALRLVYRDPEDAHEAGNAALKGLYQFGLHPRERGDLDRKRDLAVEVFGHTLVNPIATSAGIDKHAEIPDVLFSVGPSIVELGGTTPLPQKGNPYPRVFRLDSQNALINRYGLNSEGADHIAMRLRHRVRQFADSLGLGHNQAAEDSVLNGDAGVPPGSLTPGKLLAVNIAKNKFTPENDVDAITADYVYCVEQVGPYADILVVNVSSPNTPGLRDLQQTESLRKILTGVVTAAQQIDRTTKPAIMVKVSPDEDSDEQISGICQAVWRSGVDGVVVGNTTNQRPESLDHLRRLSPIEEQHLLEKGGFSGPHLFEKTLSLVKRYKKLLDEPPPSEPEDQPKKRHEPEHKLPPRKSGAVDAESKKIRASLAESSNKEAQNASISLDSGPGPSSTSDKSTLPSPPGSASDEVTASIDSGVISVPPLSSTSLSSTSSSPEPQDQQRPKQPLFQTATDPHYAGPFTTATSPTASSVDPSQQSSSSTEASSPSTTDLPPPSSSPATPKPTTSSKTKPTPSPKYDTKPKTIFATGGITTGAQALQILDAGASVAMVYTAMVYGGVGTVTRIKGAMREEIARRNLARPRRETRRRVV